ADFDSRGNLRTSGLSPYPTVAQPYITSRRLNWGDPRTYYNAPGYVQAPFSGGPTGTGGAPVGNTIIMNVQSWDSRDVGEFLRANAAHVGSAVITHVQSNGGEALASMFRYH